MREEIYAAIKPFKWIRFHSTAARVRSYRIILIRKRLNSLHLYCSSCHGISFSD
jgi:hypothetical protein